MDKVKLVEFQGKHGSLTEIFQNLSIKFAFVNAKYEQVHQPGKCRDFLGDIPWSYNSGREVKIYGMTYSYEKNPYDREVFRISMQFPKTEDKDRFIKNFHFINSMEEFAGVGTGRILETQDKNIIIVEADPVWYTETWKVSLYTFYLKCCSYENPQNPPIDTVEGRYAETLSKFEEGVLKSVTNTENSFFVDDLNNNHNCSGFISLLSGSWAGERSIQFLNMVKENQACVA